MMLPSFINTLHRYAQLVKLKASIVKRIKYKIIIAHSAFVWFFISSLFDPVSEKPRSCVIEGMAQSRPDLAQLID